MSDNLKEPVSIEANQEKLGDEKPKGGEAEKEPAEDVLPVVTSDRNLSDFFIWAAAISSGLALGGSLVLSSTPIVGAYIGAVAPIVIAATAVLSSQTEDGMLVAKDRLVLVSKFVFAFFVATIIAAAVGFSIRPTSSLIANVDRDLSNLGLQQEQRTQLITTMLRNGNLEISGENTRPDGYVLYSGGRTVAQNQTDAFGGSAGKVDCASFQSPPWSPDAIGKMQTADGHWRQVAQVLVEVERSVADEPAKRTIQSAIHSMMGC